MRKHSLPLFFLAATLLLVPALRATTIYNEAVNGDLSNNGLTPTSLSFLAGSNQVLGTTGRVTATDRDYFTFTVPNGFYLAYINVLSGTTAGGVSFFGIESGNQITLPTNAANANGLLGWIHYSSADIGTNLLIPMSTPNNGSSGFTPPLTAGNYAVWVQDFTAGTYNYGFDFVVQPTPEPTTAALFGLILASLACLRVSHRRVS